MYNPIKTQLKQAGIRMHDIENATGYTRASVHGTIRGSQTALPIQDFIARALGQSPVELWGEKYYPIKKAIKKAAK